MPRKNTSGASIRASCSLCSMTFSRKSDIPRHVRKLHSDKPQTYTCSYCSKVYQSASGRKIHEREHTGVWLHCDECGFLDRQDSVMTLHKQHKHGHSSCGGKDASCKKVSHSMVTLDGQGGKVPVKKKQRAQRSSPYRVPRRSSPSQSPEVFNTPNSSDSLSLSLPSNSVPTFAAAPFLPLPQSATAVYAYPSLTMSQEDASATAGFTHWNFGQDSLPPLDPTLLPTTPALLPESSFHDPLQTINLLAPLSWPEATQPIEQALPTNVEQPLLSSATDPLEYFPIFRQYLSDPLTPTSYHSDNNYGAYVNYTSADESNAAAFLPDNESVYWERLPHEEQLAFVLERPEALQPSSLAPPPAIPEEPQSLLDWDVLIASLAMPLEEDSFFFTF